eukprot:scaffold11296_cov128-Isochrysis_galbana.AAC.3
MIASRRVDGPPPPRKCLEARILAPLDTLRSLPSSRLPVCAPLDSEFSRSLLVVICRPSAAGRVERTFIRCVLATPYSIPREELVPLVDAACCRQWGDGTLAFLFPGGFMGTCTAQWAACCSQKNASVAAYEADSGSLFFLSVGRG